MYIGAPLRSATGALAQRDGVYITFAALRNVSSRTLVLVLWHAAPTGAKVRDEWILYLITADT